MVKRIILLSVTLLLGTALQAAEPGALKDPLRPLGYQAPAVAASRQPEATPAQWRLAAVLISAERAVAVINGQSLQVGDLLDGYTLKKIEPGSVLLQKKQNKVVLRRVGTGLKKAVPPAKAVEGSQP